MKRPTESRKIRKNGPVPASQGTEEPPPYPTWMSQEVRINGYTYTR